MTFNRASPRSLGFKIAVMCECGVSYINSGPMIDHAFDINRRIVFVMRLLGIGINGVNLFCGLMDLVNKFYSLTFAGCFANLCKATESVYQNSIKRAVEEEKKLALENENSDTELTASGDGTWKKRGHTSRFGVTTLAGKYSKKILDSCVKSTYCHSCDGLPSPGRKTLHNMVSVTKSICASSVRPQISRVSRGKCVQFEK